MNCWFPSRLHYLHLVFGIVDIALINVQIWFSDQVYYFLIFGFQILLIVEYFNDIIDFLLVFVLVSCVSQNLGNDLHELLNELKWSPDFEAEQLCH